MLQLDSALPDHLMTLLQVMAAVLCLAVLASLARGGDFTYHRDAVFTLLAVSTALMAISAVQSVRRRAQERLLHESVERITRATQAANLGLWGGNRASDMLWATPICLGMLGLPAATALTLEELIWLVHVDDRATVRATITQALQGRESRECEYRLRREESGTRWHRLRVAAGGHGRMQLLGCVMDITEQRKMEEEVERQRRSLTHLSRVGMVGQLGGALAHELKQPLTAILSNAQALQRLLERNAIDMTEVRAVIHDIINDDSRASDVIQHLRSLLKPGEFHGDTLDINHVVQETLNLVRNDLLVHRIAVSTRPYDRRLPVMADSVQLQQLLLNLILNATEAMSAEKGGAMRIVIDVTEDAMAHIAISDTGPGVKAEILERLFEPFVSTKNQGLGLGLSISRAIAVSHKGRIWAHNNPGRGATFHVALPLVAAP